MKPKSLTREEIALEEVGHTDIAPWLSRVLSGVFLVTIVSVGLIQVFRELNDLSGWFRYNYLRLLDGHGHDELFTDHTLALRSAPANRL